MPKENNKQANNAESSDFTNNPQSAENASETKKKLSANTVLVVDDEMTVRRFVRRRVQRYAPNVTTIEALNGSEGLEKLSEIREKSNRDPLLIVTDLNMPVMDGWDFIQELKSDYESRGQAQGIPVIALSATGGEKGILFMRRSVVKGRNVKYTPLISVAKESCLNPSDYDATGQEGLDAWLKFFLSHSA